MTAPIAAAPANAPLAGAASLVSSVAGQGAAAAGFDALLASLFGGPVAGETTPGLAQSLFGPALTASDGEIPTLDGDAEVEEDVTPLASADAQALAAMLAAPVAAPAEPHKGTEAQPEPAPTRAQTPAFMPVLPQVDAAHTASVPVPARPADAAPTAGAFAEVVGAVTAPIDAKPQAAPQAQETEAAVFTGDQKPAVELPAKPQVQAFAQQAPAPVPAHTPAPQHLAQAPKAADAPVAPQTAEAAQPAATEAAAEAEAAPLAPAQKERPARGGRAAPSHEPASAKAATPATPATPAAPHVDQAAVPAVTAQPATPDATEPRLEIEAAAVDAKTDKPEPTKTETPDLAAPAAQGVAAAESGRAPTHAAVVRGSPETVAHLSAQILKKLEARSTRFDLELNPANLGRVDVRVEIGAHGKISASLAFDNPQAAQELRGKAHELQRALEQAGFDLSGGLSFDVAQDRGQGQHQGLAQQQDAAPWRGRAFKAALNAAGDADVAAAPQPYLERRASGVDVRI